MKKRAWGLVAGVLAATLGGTGVTWADEPPDENTILVEEIPHIANRSVMYSLPPDPEAALESLETLPQQADDVIAMHLGRLHPTRMSPRPASRHWSACSKRAPTY